MLFIEVVAEGNLSKGWDQLGEEVSASSEHTTGQCVRYAVIFPPNRITIFTQSVPVKYSLTVTCPNSPLHSQKRSSHMVLARRVLLQH